jgi:hypothetical protein
MARWFRPLLLALVLLAVQQGGLLHAYVHASEGVPHVVLADAPAHEDDADPQSESTSCLDCLAFSAVTCALTDASGVSLPVLARQVSGRIAVPPEPTFSHCVAFQSRAPPALQS